MPLVRAEASHPEVAAERPVHDLLHAEVADHGRLIRYVRAREQSTTATEKANGEAHGSTAWMYGLLAGIHAGRRVFARAAIRPKSQAALQLNDVTA